MFCYSKCKFLLSFSFNIVYLYLYSFSFNVICITSELKYVSVCFHVLPDVPETNEESARALACAHEHLRMRFVTNLGISE